MTLRVLWTHNWPDARKSIGPFMWSVLQSLDETGIHIDLFNVGIADSPKAIAVRYSELREKARDYDLVHAQYGSLTGFLTARLPNPKVLTLRGSDWHRYRGPQWKESLHAFFAVSMSRLSVPKFDRVVVMSDRMKREVESVNGIGKVAVIPDPIDMSVFVPMDKERCRLEYHNSTSGAPWVLFNTISRTNPVKRLALAEAAVEIARALKPGLQLKIATGIEYSKMPYWINACDVALCTSTHEGWPNSIKEAIACNIPFVSTDVSDLASLAVRAPNCKVVHDDPAVIAQALVAAIDSPRNDNLRSAVEGFNGKATAEGYLRIYDEVARRCT